ncbi:MAG: hypothetical protein MJ223_01570 [Mycoplasmoidaceae bacterium]|nr:hypothetical protein [Mycoplasmoidaceae bacterium]
MKIIDVNKLNPVAIADNLLPVANNTEYDLKQQIKDLFINNYFTEVKTYNLTNKSNLDKFNIFDKKNPIRILSNNSNREFFRLSLIDNMLKVYQYNDARKLSLRPIFEIQKLFTNDQKNLNITALTLDKYIVDTITHSELLTNLNYFKSLLKQLSTILNTQFSFKQAKLNCFYENETIAIGSNNEIIGFVGKIRSSVLKDYDLNNKQIYALTINIEKLLSMYQSPVIKIKEFGVFQTISRDINIILDESNAHLVSKKLEQIKQITNIADAKVVNIFKKDNKLIYTVRYYLTDKRNFTAKDIESITKQIENLSGL